MRGPLLAAGVFLAAGAASLASGQETTGSLAGTIADETGGVLPGTSVTLAGERLAAALTTSSDSRGRYRFAALPPGRYDASFVLAGFQGANHEGLRIRLGGEHELNVFLRRSALSEAITVTGEGPIVDSRSSQVGASFDEDWVRNAPAGRTSFFDLINSAPGVSRSRTTSAMSSSLGGNTNENVYLLDGTDFTAPATGASWPWPNYDAIGEVQVITLGAPAEYGNLQGAVFNVVTRQGSNLFHGDANFYIQHQRLTGRNTTPGEDGGLPYHRATYRDLTLQLSGPILKDRLWFFGSYQYQRDHESLPGTDPARPGVFEEDRLFLKLNWQISPRHRLMFGYHNEVPWRGSDPTTSSVAPSAVPAWTGKVPTPNVTLTSTLSHQTVLELRYSGFYGDTHIDPLDGGPRRATRYNDFDTGQVSGGILYWYDNEIWRTSVSGKLSHFAADFLGGGHDFKFGVQYYRGGAEVSELGYNAYIYTYAGADGPAGYGWTRSPFHFGTEMGSIGFYADDSFRLGSRLTIDAGLRYDRSRAFYPPYPILDADGSETGRFSRGNDRLFTWNTLSPRLGFNWKLTSDGKTSLRAHYGRYHRGITSWEFGEVIPTLTPVTWGTWDFNANGFVPGSLEVEDSALREVDPAFRGSFTDQFLLGLERELAPNLALSLHFTYKRGKDYGGWVDTTGVYEDAVYVDDRGADATGQPIQVERLVGDPAERAFRLTNPDGMFSRFNGVVLHVNKRMAHNWQLSSSLVVGSSKGRVGSSHRPVQANQSGLANDFGLNPNDFVNTDHGLIGDRTAAFKTQLLVRLPWETQLGASYTWQSGRPWARMVVVPDLGIFTRILAEPIDGRRRLPSTSLLDLRVQKEFGLRGRARLALLADVFNVFNDNAYEWVENQLGTAANFGKPAGHIAPRRVMLGARVVF